MSMKRIPSTISIRSCVLRLAMCLTAMVVSYGCASNGQEEEAPKPLTPEERLSLKAEELTGAIEANPQNAELRYELGNAYFDLGRYAEAADAYSRCLEFSPNRADALCNRGLAYRRLGMTEDAVASYRAALQIEPDDETTLTNMLTLLKDAGRYEEALEPMQHLYMLRQNDLATASQYADLLFRLNRFEDAAPVYRSIVDNVPDYGIAWYRLGLCHYESGDMAEAAAVWTAALGHDPRNSQVLQALPVLYWELGQYDNAWDAVRRCQTVGVGLAPDFISRLQADSGQLGPE